MSDYKSCLCTRYLHRNTNAYISVTNALKSIQSISYINVEWWYPKIWSWIFFNSPSLCPLKERLYTCRRFIRRRTHLESSNKVICYMGIGQPNSRISNVFHTNYNVRSAYTQKTGWYCVQIKSYCTRPETKTHVTGTLSYIIKIDIDLVPR